MWTGFNSTIVPLEVKMRTHPGIMFEILSDTFGNWACIAKSAYIHVLAWSMFWTMHTYKHAAELTFAKKPLKNFLSWNGGLVWGYGMGGNAAEGYKWTQTQCPVSACEGVFWSQGVQWLEVMGKGLGGITTLVHQSDSLHVQFVVVVVVLMLLVLLKL